MTYAEKLALYEKLVATNPDVPRKGDTMPYTSLNGNMFTLLTKEGTLILRLDPETQAAFIKKYNSKLPVQYGAVMREYVEVPDTLLTKTRELKNYFDLSYAYAQSLKAKPAKKKN
jgi:TfoX/Sxy family transcriptional regulator of competence genes